MTGPRPFAMVSGADQWLRAAHEQTDLDPEAGVVSIALQPPQGPHDGGDYRPFLPAGLAFDAGCRLYHSVPSDGRVERVHWAAMRDRAAGSPPLARYELFAERAHGPLGDFTARPATSGALDRPRALCVDGDDRLFVAESGARRIVVVDLWSGELLRHARVGPATPIDVAARGRTVYALLADPPSLVALTAREGPVPVDPQPALDNPSRIALSPGGRLVVLERARTRHARIVPLDDPSKAFEVPRATDVEFESESVLVVARYPGEEMRRFRIVAGEIDERPPLLARGYDGMGIVRTPDGRIGYWTTLGFRHAIAARQRHMDRGRVTTFRLDAGEYQTVWGRLFLDACVPEGTEIRAHFLTLDDPSDAPTLPRTPPLSTIVADVPRPDLSPPMPPVALVPSVDGVIRGLHRRESGRELPWTQPEPDDPFQTYEAPIDAPAGRFLWVTLELRGTTYQSPRVRGLRAEFPTHDYLRRLPRTFSRDERVADFLRRYLAIFEGFLGEVDGRAAGRAALLDPWAAPDEVLPWLASFVGMVLDERWPERARRTAIEEAVWLFRYRGTVRGLRRFLEIYLNVPPILIERFRLRGLGGAILGDVSSPATRSVLGVGFRVGGAVGTDGETPLAGTPATAFATHAHRFSVIVPAALDAEQLDVVQHILDVHRPAHTLVDVCTVGAGMRVGRGLHLGLSSVIGRTGGFATAQLDASVIGRGAILGRPGAGGRVGSSRLGGTTMIG